jgi:hypothetical protein
MQKMDDESVDSFKLCEDKMLLLRKNHETYEEIIKNINKHFNPREP